MDDARCSLLRPRPYAPSFPVTDSVGIRSLPGCWADGIFTNTNTYFLSLASRHWRVPREFSRFVLLLLATRSYFRSSLFADHRPIINEFDTAAFIFYIFRLYASKFTLKRRRRDFGRLPVVIVWWRYLFSGVILAMIISRCWFNRAVIDYFRILLGFIGSFNDKCALRHSCHAFCYFHVVVTYFRIIAMCACIFGDMMTFYSVKM